MKLTVTDLNLLIDTLNGSLQIDDRGNFMFHYSTEYRKELSLKIQKFLNSININIDIEENIGE